MKKILVLLAFICLLTVSCKDEKAEEVVVPKPTEQEVYQPKHLTKTVDFKDTKTYNYFNTPTNVAAKKVEVNYDKREPYTKAIEVIFIYPSGDTITYVLENFGIWTNENGMHRVLTDNDCTVWIQGQTKSGKFREFVFFGDPKHNGSKISPNSYYNLPHGVIKYRK